MVNREETGPLLQVSPPVKDREPAQLTTLVFSLWQRGLKRGWGGGTFLPTGYLLNSPENS